MAHAHDHHGGPMRADRKLVIATVLTTIFFCVEIVAALMANSLALMGDAFHNITDSFALLLALSAVYLGRRRPTRAKSYGYQRAGLLAAFINASTLLGLTGLLLFEAWRRFGAPQQVDTAAMLVVASFGLLLNGGLTYWLHEEGRHDVNIRSATVHMFGDALASLAVVVGAVMIRMTGSLIIDPAVTALLAVFILYSSWGVLREAVNLLLDGTPNGIDSAAVERDLSAQEGVFGIHHLHIWALGPSRPALSCHLMLGDVSLRSAGEILERSNQLLMSRYGITHTTIQVEYASCDVGDADCAPDVSKNAAH